jgi:putative oxidoreductase
MQALEKLKPLALLLLRVTMGAIFVYYGYPKLIVHPRQNVQWFMQHGFPGYFSYISGVVELFGGLTLIAGIFTRITALALAIEMAVALWKATGFLSDPLAVSGYQLPLILCAAAFTLATVGAGVISLDYVFFRSGRGPSRKPKARD